MAQILVPEGGTSPTALKGYSAYRDSHVYSALVVQHSGTGTQKLFTVPQGQSVPKMNGTSTASTVAHQQTYNDLTTNMTQAGQLGAGIGDVSVRALGITFEQAGITQTTGAIRTDFGMGQLEMADVCSKAAFELKVGGTRQIIGPVWSFPNAGTVAGSVSTTGSGQTASIANNGAAGQLRRLKLPIPIGRNDNIEGVFSVPAGSLSFTNSGSQGNPSLVWVNLYCTVRADVRG